MNNYQALADYSWLIGTLAAFFAFFLIAGIVYYVLMVIAQWKLFTKAGEKGWKAIIPFYNFYIQVKLTWAPKFFWFIIGGSVLMGICSSISTSTTGVVQVIFSILGFALSIAILVLSIMSFYRLAKAYGHGGGYTVGLLFLNFIFMLVLAFGSSKYQGNVYLDNQANKAKAAEKPAESKEDETK